MAHENEIRLKGYLADKPQLRTLPSGMKVANARLGETKRWQSSGQSKEHTNWHSLVFWGDMLADISQLFEKGNNLAIKGSIQYREFTPQGGKKRSVTEIHVQEAYRIAPLPKGHEEPAPALNTAPPAEEAPPTDASWPV